MRSMIDLLTHLRTNGAVLTVVEGNLKCSVPKGLLTPALKEELAARKPEIIAFLQASLQTSKDKLHGTSISKADRSVALPLSFAQQRLWFLSQLDPASTAYNIAAALRMTGELNVSALERTFLKIIHRHEALRTCFKQHEGEPYAVVTDGGGWKLDLLKASDLPAREGSEAMLEAIAGLSRQPFDLAAGPLFRAHLIQESDHSSVLLLTIHHIICDGWSMGVFVQEFSQLYAAYTTGHESSLPELQIQYADFAAWQRTPVASSKLAAQLPYWKQQLLGAPPVVGFPLDHLRPLHESVRAGRAKLVLPPSMTAELEALSQRCGVTLFMTLLAGFNLLLSRYSGQKDIVIGSPSANRSRPELNPLIGFFVNNLVLRTDLTGNPTFAQLLGRVREVSLKASEHQDVPFDHLVTALHTERSLEHSPLFQVMFALQNFPFEELELPGLRAKAIEMEPETARFDVTVEVFPRGGSLHCYFDYKSELYEPETIDRIQQHYRTILQSVLANPDQNIDEIDLLPSAERQTLLFDWNQTAAVVPETMFHQRFAAHALSNPERTALLCGEEALTYSELNDRANRIAALLLSRGAGPGHLIAIFIGRSSDMVAAMMAIAKAGAAYVPLDPAYPAGRIANILDTAKPLLALTTRELLGALPEERGEVICLDDPLEYAFTESRNTAPAAANLNDLAYVIFTSGSTGTPKGVQIPHRALTNFLESMSTQPGLAASDVLLAVTTVSFDIAGLELLLPLYVGGTVCVSLAPSDPQSLMMEMERFRPTVMQATPATWKMLIASGWRGDRGLKVLCGGEALDTQLARSLVVRSDELWNMYGPTETTIWSAAIRIADAGLKSIPVGRPIANTTFYVLDDRQQPVPQGVAGELWIGGEGLARGYLHRDDLTAERFVSCPFPQLEGARMYRTGDLVRYRGDGTLDFFGRLDHQVKLRGFRIELGEIEAAMRTCAGVLDAVTLLREDAAEKYLVGYLTVQTIEPPALAAVREHLRATLPEYMVPSVFVFLKDFPRLPNGKLDRSRLPAPDKMDGASEPFVAPDTDMQRTVAAAFRKVLKIDHVGLDNNFFDMGANSLLIVKVHAELNRHLEASIPLITFFQYPTVRALARFIEAATHKPQMEAADAMQGQSQ